MHICHGVLLSHKKEGNLVIFDNTDEPGRHYAKCNKPDKEKQILHDLKYLWSLKKWNSYTQGRMVVTMG